MGTTNYIEFKIGYIYKYVVGASDLSPLRILLKKDVKEIAIYLCVPKEIIVRAPTAGLFENQTDEDESGLTYETKDDYFSGNDISKDDKSKIDFKVYNSKHKREPTPYPIFDTKREENEK